MSHKDHGYYWDFPEGCSAFPVCVINKLRGKISNVMLQVQLPLQCVPFFPRSSHHQHPKSTYIDSPNQCHYKYMSPSPGRLLQVTQGVTTWCQFEVGSVVS